MNNFKIGQRVEYVADDANDKYYPPKGTFGTITGVYGNLLSVEWDNGTLPGPWICYTHEVIPVEEDDNNDT